MLIFFHKTNALQKEENDMWKKLKNWIAIGILAIAACLNCNVASAKGTEVMDSDNLIYECNDVTFQDSGTLLVEGTIDCSYCKGSGTCNQCNGSGRKSNRRMCTYN